MNEFMMMNSVIGRIISAFDILSHVFIVFMFIAAIWKPQRIYSYGAFRYSLLLFAGALAVPATVEMIWNGYHLVAGSPTPSPSFGRSSQASDAQSMILSTALATNIARILMASSVATGILALIDPDRRRRESSATNGSTAPLPQVAVPAAPHPLDIPPPVPAARTVDPARVAGAPARPVQSQPIAQQSPQPPRPQQRPPSA